MNALLLALVYAIGQTDEYVQDYRHDFRGASIPDELAQLPWNYPAMTVEKEGLRIRLPKERKMMGQVGIHTTFPVKGDFEITAGYEILHADPPSEGWGVGVTLYVYVDEPVKNAAGIYRLERPKGVQTIHWDCAVTDADGRRDYHTDRVSSDAKIFRLRMTRKNRTLNCFWAQGLTGDDFREIGTAEFLSDDLTTVALNTTTGGKPFNLDVRFLDLRIRSSIKSLSDPDPAQSPGDRLWQRRRLWLVLLLLGVALTAGALSWRLRRRLSGIRLQESGVGNQESGVRGSKNKGTVTDSRRLTPDS